MKTLHEDSKGARGYLQMSCEGNDQRARGIFSYDWYNLALKASR